MQELIKIEKHIVGAEEVNAVSARELHKVLDIKKDFSNWIKGQIDRAGLRENVDYIVSSEKVQAGHGMSVRRNYTLATDAAKHIAMMSQGAKAQAVRDYFIAVEKEHRASHQNLMPIIEAMMQQMALLTDVVKELQTNQKKQIANALTPEQLDDLKRGVMRATKPLAEVHNLQWGEAMRKVYQELNGRMGVFSYYQIAPHDYEEALTLLERMRIQKEEQLTTGEVKTFLSVNVEIVESKDERY